MIFGDLLSAFFWRLPIRILNIWGGNHRSYHGKTIYLLERYVCGKTYLLKISSNIYNFKNYSSCHWNIIRYTILSISLMFLWVFTSPWFIYLRYYLHMVRGFKEPMGILLYLYISKGYQYPLDSAGDNWRLWKSVW